MKKSLFIILILIVLLGGCDNKMKSNQKLSSKSEDEAVNSDIQNEQSENSTWYSKYNLETDKITIAVADYDSDQPHKQLKLIVEISDTNDVTLIKEAINFPSWEEVPAENEIQAEPYFYIIINDTIMIRLLSDFAYGGVREYTIKDGLYIGGDYNQNYNVPIELLKIVWQFVEPYSEKLDVKKPSFEK